MSETKCWCRTCREDEVVSYLDEAKKFPITYPMTRMILCPICGNKRCPHANNHEFACTNSNEPGQPGSAY